MYLIVFLFVANCYSQSSNIKKVESIEFNYQNCLDSGIDMLGCSKKYYFFCDKLLNEVYQSIRAKLTTTDKEKLKNEQLKWLKQRDAFFKRAYILAKEEAVDLPQEDLEMIYIDKKGDFVKERVKFLIKKFNI